jgi:signal transduction histidine kinase
MASQNRLLSALNYYELPNYKVNYLFNSSETSFAFNQNQAVLRSIIDKAIPLIDTGTITKQWMSKTYDYRRKVVEGRQMWIIGASSLAFIVLLTLVIYIKGIFDKRRLTALVAEKTQEAYSASDAKSKFIASMNHEMRTPMNVIIGITDMMLDDDKYADADKEPLRKINTAGNTLMGLINDILDISKVEAGKMDIIPMNYEFSSFLNDIITLNIIRIQDKPIDFQMDIDENLPHALFGDELKVKQVINNILSNAFKYTREGTVTLTIKCEKQGAGTILTTFTVKDTGIGIKAEDLPKLFGNYSQVDKKANRTIEGTGLGLALTKAFVELMNGEISVESEYGKGSTFTIRIPQGFVSDGTLGKENAENLRRLRHIESTKEVKKLVRPDLGYARVLVVDDFPTNLDVAAGMLRKYKMKVDCVTSGQEALDIMTYSETHYNAIFMDHMMPGMDGVEATKKIRDLGSEYSRSIPIIALTANATSTSEEFYLANGFTAFVAKPFKMTVLDEVVQKFIKKGEIV